MRVYGGVYSFLGDKRYWASGFRLGLWSAGVKGGTDMELAQGFVFRTIIPKPVHAIVAPSCL